eukprot:1142141-Pelagomonas_calceolata.AAC.2
MPVGHAGFHGPKHVSHAGLHGHGVLSKIEDPSMWATLASMAMANKELNTAETAFAEVDEVDKLHFVMKVGGRVADKLL